MALKARVYTVALVFVVLLLTPLLFLTRYQVLESEALNEHPHNPRRGESLELRGSLLDRNLQPLAYSQGQQRVYPLGQAAGSLLGYFCMSLGAGGLERSFSKETQCLQVPRHIGQAITQIGKGNLRGDDVVLSIDADLQRQVYELMGGHRGAAVVMDSRSGELLALVSCPSYDSNRVSEGEYWEQIISDDISAPLLDRSIQGLYPPGSTFKTLIMAAALEEGCVQPDEVFNCPGSLTVGDFVLNCMSRHDNISLSEALTYSCNVAFADIGLRLGISKIDRWMERFGMSDNWPLVPGAEPAYLPTASAPSAAAEAAIGQADVLVSPLHMARVASVIAGRGQAPLPQLYLGRARHNRLLEQVANPASSRVLSAESAEVVARDMGRVVVMGSGYAAALPGIRVAGKTGTAENNSGEPHAWFIGFAPAEEPRLAVAVVLENAGGGGRYAAPLAREILRLGLEKVQ